MREPTTMGRPREFDVEAALTKIMDVFWAKGFEGATLNDLVNATGLKKGSLYAAFGDKRAMYLKALALYDRTAIEEVVRLLAGSGTPEKRIGQFLQSAIDAVAVRKDRRGCFLCNASADQAMVDPETERAVKASLRRLGRALEEVLSQQTITSIDDKRRHAAAQHLLSVYVGLRVLAKAGHPIKALKEARKTAVGGILAPDREENQTVG